MNYLFPITTIILIVLGAFCIFTSIENNRRIMVKSAGRVDNKPQVYSPISTENIEG
ncbi:hypothetical protein [Paenibacillus ferrarius]|uniref:hypothetical protein n=1 Tax=Paenibacillus ferrarius TaxID=1469647 RepID=UPI001301BDCF|nr:hypothetical protein [Paenibacillus ferrarius]